MSHSSRGSTISSEITRLLSAWSDSGNESALDRLMPLVYDELRAIAARRMGPGDRAHTLQPTALVHEAYTRLVGSDAKFEDRAHFFALAARLMRNILIDHARARKSQKRGGGGALVTLPENVALEASEPLDVLAVDEALKRLAEVDERKARVVELHFFGGLTYTETSTALGISEATVDRDLRMAKAWLAEHLADVPGEGP